MAQVETRTVGPDEAGMRLDRWFRTHFPDLSFGHLQKLLRSGQIRVDGGRAKTNTRLEPGQSVRIPPMGMAEPRRDGDDAPWEEGEGTGMSDPAEVHRKPRPGDAGSRKAGADARTPRNRDADDLRSYLLYEDDDVFVFNKPAGLAVQGG